MQPTSSLLTAAATADVSPHSLQAVADVAASIRAGFYDIAIAAGVESISTHSTEWEVS